MNTAFWFGVALQLLCVGALVWVIAWAVLTGREATPDEIEASRRNDIDPWGGP